MTVFTGDTYTNCADTQYDNWRGPYCYDGHPAIDYSATTGTAVHAAASGEVTHADWYDPENSSLGRVVVVDHSDGHSTWYCHLNAIQTYVGAQVASGDTIGTAGGSGRYRNLTAFSPHLHFEVRNTSTQKPTDPFGWRGTGDDPLGTPTAGGEASVCRWDDWQCGDIFVEEGSVRFASGSIPVTPDSWNQFAFSYAAFHRPNDNPVTAWGRWCPPAGTYAVHAYIPQTDLPSKTTQARYVLRSADGSAQVVTVNQAVSNVWVDLGTYTQGPTCASSYVYLQNDTDDPASSTNVVWDLVRFTPDPYYVPLVARATSMSPLGGTWGSGLQVQNLSTSATANVSMAFYWAMGTSYPGQLATTYSTSLSPRATGAWHLPSGDSGGIPSVPAGFRGSVVITSDQPLAVNANTETTGNPVRVGTVRGVEAPDTTLRFPQVEKAYWNWNSFVVIQNTTGSNVSATIRYYHPAGGEVAGAAQTQQSIPAYSSWIVHQSQNANLPSGWVGSAVVTSSQPLAGVAALYEGMSGASTADLAHYGAQTVAATTVHVPKLVREYYGYSSGLTIQNAGTSATNVTIQYKFAGYTFYQTLPQPLQPGAPAILFLPDVGELDDMDGWDQYWRSGTAVVTASQPLVAIANERYDGADPLFQGHSVSYGAFAAGSGSTAIGFSQVTSRYYGYSGGVQVQNVGGATTTVTAVFSAPGQTETRQATVAPGDKAQWFLPSDLNLTDWNGSVRVTASQPLVGIANNAFRADWDDHLPIIYGDSFSCYESTDAN